MNTDGFRVLSGVAIWKMVNRFLNLDSRFGKYLCKLSDFCVFALILQLQKSDRHRKSVNYQERIAITAKSPEIRATCNPFKFNWLQVCNTVVLKSRNIFSR